MPDHPGDVEEQAVRERHAVIGADIDKIALGRVVLEKGLVDEDVLTVLRKRLHR